MQILGRNKLYNGTTPMLLAHYRKNSEILEKLKRAGASFGCLILTGSPFVIQFFFFIF
jgi:hypothetical protein